MNKLFTAFTLLLMATQLILSQESTALRILNVYQGRQYEITVTHAELDKAPLWRTEQENAPLGPRTAVRIAREYVTRFVPNSNDWRLNRIALEPAGRREGQWIYVIEFTPYEDTKVLLSGVRQFKIPVLLNGVVVDPQISDVSRRKKE